MISTGKLVVLFRVAAVAAAAAALLFLAAVPANAQEPPPPPTAKTPSLKPASARQQPLAEGRSPLTKPTPNLIWCLTRRWRS